MSCALEALGVSPPGTATHPAVEKECPLKGPEQKVSAQKRKDVVECVDLLWGLLRQKTSARAILTLESFENAIAVIYALGGSTNAVLHLLAIAREVSICLPVLLAYLLAVSTVCFVFSAAASLCVCPFFACLFCACPFLCVHTIITLTTQAEVPLSIEDFNRVGSKVPLIGNLSPHGPWHIGDLDELGLKAGCVLYS
jgi:dihydroxyacid dehydratase/phosphogluconate dehydratase